MPTVVSVIGAGRIAAPVIAHIREAPGLRLGTILTRGPGRGIADGVTDIGAFLASPADIVIDAAGPGALRQYGPRILAQAELWTVGASALADDDFRERMRDAALRHGRTLRLFSDWLAAADQCVPGVPARLRIRAARPGLGGRPGTIPGTIYEGPLREAARLYPNDVNSAVAAALCGPGLDNTVIELIESGPDGEHAIHGEIEIGALRLTTQVDLGSAETGALHPVAGALIAALERRTQPFRYG
jgi:predicted dinucleotide-utilizing enzyme